LAAVAAVLTRKRADDDLLAACVFTCIAVVVMHAAQQTQADLYAARAGAASHNSDALTTDTDLP
jgi:hypothetical protein